MGNQSNVLMIVVDCLRADRCPAGDESSSLEFWPAIRDRGTTFTQLISTASMTPPCFASLLSGQYTFVHGIRSIGVEKLFNPNLPTLQSVLKSADYTTYARVTGPLLEGIGLDNDFDDYQHRIATDNKACPGVPDTIYTEWGDTLIREFASSAFSQPWFMLLHLFEVHTPRQLNGLDMPRSRTKAYDLAWRQLDKRLAELLTAVPENTTVLFTADHGEAYMRRADHTLLGSLHRKLRRNLKLPRRTDDLRGHGFHVFDELVRIPCCIVSEGVPQGKVIDQQVRQIDLMPTLLELQGLVSPTQTQGRSLVPLIHGLQAEELPALVESGSTRSGRHWQGLRTSEWKYAEPLETGQSSNVSPALYRLADDPGERRNVIDSNRDVADRMRRQMEEILQSGILAESEEANPLPEETRSKLQEQLRALGYL